MNKKVFLVIDSVLFLFCLLGIYQIYLKADIPFSMYENDHLVINEVSYNLPIQKGDHIVFIDDHLVSSREQIEILLDAKNIGDKVKVSIERSGNIIEYNINLVPFYSLLYLSIVSLVGLLFFSIAIIVLFKSDNYLQVKAFHNVVICTAVIITTTWGNYKIEPLGLGYIIRFIFHIAYTFAPTLFLHFTMVFPTNRFRLVYISPFYLVSFYLSIMLNVIFIVMVTSNDFTYSINYIQYFNYTRIFVVFCVLLAILFFILIYGKLKSSADKKKLKWVLLGFLIGPISFILFWVIPQGVTTNGLLPEELILILMSAIPITFGIAIVKYHLYDIDLIINRGLVYVIVISILIALYVSIIITASYLLSSSSVFTSVIAAVIIALIIQPVKNYVQGFVDKRFFRIHYDYREAINRTFKQIRSSACISELADKITVEINNLIPVEKIGVFIYNSTDISLSILSHKNLPGFDKHKILLSSVSADELKQGPIAVMNCVETGISVRISKAKSLTKRNIALIFPVNVSGELKGVLVMGKKKSGNNYYKEDFDLLDQLSNEASSAIERIILQEKIIIDRLEKEKLAEMNQLKSYFVSSVSHEFKTPLTSIKLFTELLETNKQDNNFDNSSYLKIIQGESDRLGRMIDNVLDLVKIEKGIKKYQFSDINLNEAAEQAINIMQYQLQMQAFKLFKNLYKQELTVRADKDAIIECIVNLLSNAMKYSREKKEITIETFPNSSYRVLVVKDKGIGICAEDLQKIFKPYFRSGDKGAQGVEGTGLGLAIVKHAMDSHNGKIEIESELNKGTSFKLLLPVKRDE